MGHGFFAQFDQVRIINLIRRTDRRQEIVAELQRLGVEVDGRALRWFDAIEPTMAAPFASPGAHGCYLSHLDVLRQARADGVGSLLILEDDAHFGRAFRSRAQQVQRALAGQAWDIFYAGYYQRDPLTLVPPLTLIAPDQRLRTTHALAFRQGAIARAIPFLEDMLNRPMGHPDGGAMPVDGAYNWFRRANPDLRTFVAAPQIITQRSSVSDITPVRWRDVAMQVSGLRKLKNWLR